MVGSDKLGNFIVTTPLLRGLRERFPDAVIDFYGSPVNRAFEEACPWIDWRTDVFPPDEERASRAVDGVAARTEGQGYALGMNCDGFNPYTTELVTRLGPTFAAGAALTDDLSGPLPLGDHPYHRILADPDWTSPDFLERYEGHLTSNYIGELFARMAFVETDFFAISLESAPPPFDVPDVLVHANANRTAKLWPAASWLDVAEWCGARGLEVGLVGVLPKPGREGTVGYPIEAALAAHPAVTDLRDRTSPIELAGALERCRACVTVDSGPLHVAAAVGCPTLAVFGNDAEGVGASPLDLWLPRVGHVERVPSARHCDLCLEDRFKDDACLRPIHLCMEGVAAGAVIERLDALLA